MTILPETPLFTPAYQIEGICKSTERLRQFPESGRHLPEFPNLTHRDPKIDFDFWGNLQVGCQTRQRIIFETSRIFNDTVRNKNCPITKYGSQIAGL